MSRILVVDDEPQILRALRINLVARQYDVVTAAGGAQALAMAVSAHPDLVILDLGLPDLDGVEVIHRLRLWSRVPIIVLSGRKDSRDKVEALDAGADDYVDQALQHRTPSSSPVSGWPSAAWVTPTRRPPSPSATTRSTWPTIGSSQPTATWCI